MLSLYKFFASKGQMFGFLLGVALVAITILSVVLGIDSAGYAVGDDFNKMMKAEGNTETFEFFNLVAYIPPILVLLIIAIMVLFGIMQLVKNPKGSMKILIGLAIVAILGFIFYSTSISESTGRLGALIDKFEVSDTASKFISAGLKTVLSLFGGAIVLMFVSEIRNLFK